MRAFAYTLLAFLFCGLSGLTAAQEPDLYQMDVDPHLRTPLTHGFWFPKLLAIGEEFYRGRLVGQGSHRETGELPDPTDPDGHLGFTAVNATRWLITHHWFGGDDELAEHQFYSRHPNWFFDPQNPSRSVMGILALFRWGMLSELEARRAIDRLINAYTDRPYSILSDGAWLAAMADLSRSDFTVNDGPRAVPNPLGLPEDQAIRNEMAVIMTHHFLGRNRGHTDAVMTKIYPDLVRILEKFNAGLITDREARQAIAQLVTAASLP